VPFHAYYTDVGAGRCIGEGFDDARRDTLLLALPISWKGAPIQFAGRLHRENNGKQVRAGVRV